MTTLAQPLGPLLTDFTAEVDAAVSVPAQIYRIDGETVYLRRAEGTTWTLIRERGAARASHEAGATLTPIYPVGESGGAGGGSVSVEVPPAAPVAVTNIIAPGAAIAGGEATLLYFTLLTADVDVDTPNFLSPSDAGVSVLDIPAGALVQAFAVQTTVFDEVCEVDLSAGDNPDTGLVTLGVYSHVGEVLVPAFGALEPSFNAGATGSETATLLRSNIGRWLLVTAGIHIYASAYPDLGGPGGIPTTGALSIYAIIATPAS